MSSRNARTNFRMRKSSPGPRETMEPPGALSPSLSLDRLQDYWRELACRYFDDRLPPIRIEWSRRLTASAGLFVSLVGPRARRHDVFHSRESDRLIRLSLPLLANQPDREVVRTLAHEMIHQWQYDVRRCRPSHGRDFRDKMEELNRDGWGITVRHTLTERVDALAKYAWRCLRCGTVYQRQRRTISPQHHRCGYCYGLLAEDVAARVTMNQPWSSRMRETAVGRSMPAMKKPIQLHLDFSSDLPLG